MRKIMDFFNVVSLVEARKRIFDTLSLKTETVPLLHSFGRILASGIKAKEDVPSFNRSIVDGYAVKSSDTFGASEAIPAMLEVTGKVAMGENISFEVKSGQAVYIPTGGMLPNGSDSVVMIENSRVFGELVAIHKPSCYKENVISAGEDIAEGEIIFSEGQKITATRIGSLASQGITEVKVYKNLIFSIISSGDELVDFSEVCPVGKVRDTNSVVLAAEIEAGGFVCRNIQRVKDSKEQLENAIKNALENSDIVLISGGSSVGEKDFTYNAIAKFSEILFYGVALKPGKPTIAGKSGSKLIMGLAGHPTAALLSYKMLAEETIFNKMNYKGGRIQEAKLLQNFPSASGRTTCQLVKLINENGKYFAEPLKGKSGLVSLMGQADGYIILEADKEGLYTGDNVTVILL